MDLSFGGLAVALLVGSIGVGLFIYGKKQGRIPHFIAGVALSAYPYFVSNPWISAGIAVVLVALLWGAVRMGY